MRISTSHPSADRFGRLATGLSLASVLLATPVVTPGAAATSPVNPEPALIAAPEPDWPQFRGPRRDGISDERGLLKTWPEGGPKRLWASTHVGRGFSSPVISRERLFITGDVADELRIFALDLEGRPIWSAANGRSWQDSYPGARSTPTISGDRLFHMNAHGRIASLDAASGREHWNVNALERFQGQNITWGMSECLVVDDRAVYATVGGREALMVALDRNTGELLWKSAPIHDAATGLPESSSYVSPILVRFQNRRLLIGCSSRHLVCLDADTGMIQWTRHKPTSYSVLATMPTLAGGGIFMTAPHGRGGQWHRLLPGTSTAGVIGVEDGWTTRLDTCQGGVVHMNGRIFGSYYPGRKGWAALDARTGETVYETGDFVKGALLQADRRLYALCEDGWMLLLEPAAARFEIKGRFQFAKAPANDAWAHPVIHNGRLYLRHHETLQSFDVKAP